MEFQFNKDATCTNWQANKRQPENRICGKKDIAHGDELFFDYGLKTDPDFPWITTNAKDKGTSLEKLDSASVKYVDYHHIWVLFKNRFLNYNIDQRFQQRKGTGHRIQPSRVVMSQDVKLKMYPSW